MKRLLLAAAAAVMLFAPAAARAELKEYTLDKPHTQILFFVDHMGVSKSSGEFLDYSGKFTFDPENVKNPDAKVDVTIKTDSLDLGDAKWDEHTKSKDLLNVAQFPEMKFASTGVEFTGDKTAKLTGDLTLMGVTKPVTLAVTYNACGVHAMSKAPICGFSATGSFKRSEFGLTYGIPMVGDDVELRIEVEAAQQAATNQ